MTLPPGARLGWLVLVGLLLAACAGSAGPSGSATGLPDPTAATTPRPSRATASPFGASDPSPQAAIYPPSYTGQGPPPLYGRAGSPEAGDGTSDAAAASAVEMARDRLAEATSYRFWMSMAATGPAADGLETKQPLVLAGTVVGEPPTAAAWSVTSPLGYPGRTISYTVVGSTVWCDSGIGIWTVFDGADAEVARADRDALQPGAMFATTFMDRSVALEMAGRQQIGSAVALRMEASDTEKLPLSGWWAGLDGEVRSFVLWVTIDGVPLQAEVAGVVRSASEEGPFRLLLQIEAIGDPANAVEPPV